METYGETGLSRTGARGRDCRPALAFRLTLRLLRSHPLAPPRTADFKVLLVFTLTIESRKAFAFMHPTRTTSNAPRQVLGTRLTGCGYPVDEL